MKVSVEVKGKAADRFRAYAAKTLTRKPAVADHAARAKEGLAPFKREDRIKYEAEQVAFTGDISGASFAFDAAGTVVTRLVLYSGPVDGEAVVGSAAVNAAGTIEVEIVEPS